MKNIYPKLAAKYLTKKNLKFEIVFIVIAVLAIWICLMPALRNSVWPQGTDFWYKTALYAKHFKQGDLFPVWSPNDAYNIGTPLPLFYHKTFYYLAGPLVVLTHSLKVSILLSISFFMLVGAYGMRFALRKFTDHKIFLLLVPLTLLFSNYTFTDWLVRDDMAEFAAMMLVPWVVWWCLKLLIDKKFSLSIAIILFLLVNAHNVIALFALLPCTVAYGLFLLKEKGAGFRRTIKQASLSALLLVVMLAPLLLLEKLFLRYYDPSKITQAGYLATDNFHPFGQYLYYSKYEWLNAASVYNVQIDFGILIPLALTLIAGTVSLFTQRSRVWMKKHLSYILLVFYVLNILIYTFLQLKISKSFYLHLSFMQFLQFPWRLLIFITIFSIIYIAYIATRYKNKTFLSIFSIVWLATFVLLSPTFKTLEHTFSPTQFSYNVPAGQNPGSGTLMGIGEYLPRVYRNGKQETSQQTVNMYANLTLANNESEVLDGGPCAITKPPVQTYEALSFTMIINCMQKAQVALPVSYNDFTIIKDVGANKTIAYSRTDKSDPRIIITLSSGETKLSVQLPTLPRIIDKLL